MDDGAADDQGLKDFFQSEWTIELLAAIGIPVCRQGYALEFLTYRHDTRTFVFHAPWGENALPVCWQCPAGSRCYGGNAGARRVTIGFDRLPWLDPEFPQVSKRFGKVMARRTVIERLHKLMKYDFGDDRLSKRGTKAFQARLDKTFAAMRLTLPHGCGCFASG